MRILHTNMLRGWGGQSNRILVEAVGTKAAGHEVALAVPRGAMLGFRGKMVGLEVFSDFEFKPPISFLKFYSDLIAFRKLVEDWQPDIIHTHGSQDTWITIAAKQSAKVKFPVVVRTKHNIFPWKPHRLNRWLYRHIDAFVTISSFIDRQVGTFPGIGDKPRSMIPSAPNREALEKEYPSVRGQIPGLTPDKFLWGSTGRLRSEKGFDVLLRAFARVRAERPDAFLAIAGNGSDRAALEQQAASLGLGPEALAFLGFREDVPALLQSLDAYVLASRAEGLGTAILEALCVGLPVVATNVGGIPDSVTHDETGLLVPPDNDVSLAAAMVRIMENDILRKSLREAGRERVNSHFTEEKLVEKTVAFYLEIFRAGNMRS